MKKIIATILSIGMIACTSYGNARIISANSQGGTVSLVGDYSLAEKAMKEFCGSQHYRVIEVNQEEHQSGTIIRRSDFFGQTQYTAVPVNQTVVIIQFRCD
jgi:hypothetical protein